MAKIGGFIVADIFNKHGMIETDAGSSLLLQNIFIGVILTATSVSITVETLKEMGKLNTQSGNTILGAAVIDDILGIVALTIISSMADKSVKISMTLLKILIYFVFVIGIILIFCKLFDLWCGKSDAGLRRYSIMALVFCMVMAFMAEAYFGVADITGAYIAGVAVSMTKKDFQMPLKMQLGIRQVCQNIKRRRMSFTRLKQYWLVKGKRLITQKALKWLFNVFAKSNIFLPGGLIYFLQKKPFGGKRILESVFRIR